MRCRYRCWVTLSEYGRCGAKANRVDLRGRVDADGRNVGDEDEAILLEMMALVLVPTAAQGKDVATQSVCTARFIAIMAFS
mmetsp:Transcript_40038/g.84078  ORF Transcript_40038/g.84078 Transcript_40038/m.84078 type:complete len:81 (+) Transcript_40038:856-1098(+)